MINLFLAASVHCMYKLISRISSGGNFINMALMYEITGIRSTGLRTADLDPHYGFTLYSVNKKWILHQKQTGFF